MSLPEMIEIVPLAKPVEAGISVPGSKSITNRALILAALADGETTLRGALWSEDTQVMVACLQELGFMVNVAPDPREFCNRTITVYGLGGRVPPGGPQNRPVDLFVGNAGTAARFLAAFVCLGQGTYRLDGTSRMHERPQASLFSALRQLGYQIESHNNRLPAVISGAGPRPGSCRLSIEESSQFASALLLCAKAGGWQIEITGENAEESPYVAMTREMIQQFPGTSRHFLIEPDASSGSYFWAAGWLTAEAPAAGESPGLLSPVKVVHWPHSDWQVDARFHRFWPLPRKVSRTTHLGDSIMTAMMLAPFADAPTEFTDLGRLRLQECERVAAVRTELAKCGVDVVEQGDSLEIRPSQAHGAVIETHDDHRMAMCFAILGLKVPGVRINNPACVKKTFPNFFQKLAAPPPNGLGATILDCARRERPMAADELFAD